MRVHRPNAFCVRAFFISIRSIMRDFEKISFETFKKQINDDIELYNSYLLPQRDSFGTARI